MKLIFDATDFMGAQLRVTSQPSLTIASLLKRPTRPVFLLGAGCSVRSGIPASEALVGQIAKWGWCVAHARNVDDPTIARTDWWPWLTRQTWFRHEASIADQFPVAVEALLRPQEDRKAFFRRILNPGLPASRGYQLLAQLLARKVILTALTTNFDQILAGECRSTAAVHHVDEIRTPDDFRLISTIPEYPQIIYLHGSVDHYTDQNIEQETKTLNAELVEKLYPLIRDHPLVVIGYRGNEASIMQHLLLNQAERCSGYRRGIYWCHRGTETPTGNSPLLTQLAATVGSNFQFVQVEGFDELMIELANQLPELVASTSMSAATSESAAPQIMAHDLQPTSVPLDRLDQALLKAKLVAYSEAVRLPKPALGTDEALVAAMAERNLAVRRDGSWPTSEGGRLLFARSPDDQLPSALIEVEIEGDAAWIIGILEQDGSQSASELHVEFARIEGNLWVQLESLLTLLAKANRPFRLKGHTSREIYPYPPLALKEIATNLLAHRDYAEKAPSRVRITQTKITFVNPGGLTDHVRQQLRDRELQSVIQASARGIKGYRNPVIADFFFSAGAMDKEGSGLPDVVSEAANNLNDLTFGPINENRDFRVEIFARPEALAVDPTTRTARSVQRELRYSPNLLSIAGWPKSIWRIPTIATGGDLKTLREGGAPPFSRIGDALWTFADPASEQTVGILQSAADAKIEKRSVEDFLTDPAAYTAIPWLLNSALEKHLDRLSLRHRFMGNSIRAYYPHDNGTTRTVSYRGLFKQASRIVAKPVVSRTTSKLLFWEHKAIALRFERFGDMWALSLLPTYVFTTDGADTWIESHRIGPRTTSRTARDYNPTVLHNLVFWSRILSGTTDSRFLLPLDCEAPSGDPTMDVALEISSLIPIAAFEEQSDSSRSVAAEEPFEPLAEEELDTEDDAIAGDPIEEDLHDDT